MLLPLTITRHATLTRHSRVTAVLLHTTNALYQSGTYFIRGRSRVCRQVVRMASADAASADAPTWKERQREAIDAQACSKEAAANGKPKVIIITGPTAVGKSHTALAVAKQLDGEIISADSVQVYRGMNIGADKRGKVPILVGGSGLYLRWFMFGKPSTPPATAETVKKADDALEAAFAAAEAAIGRPLKPAEAWQAAAELVASLGDPISAKKLENQPNSWYRMRRVLQILLHTGTPLADQDIKLTSTLRYDVRAFFLSRPRMELYRRIDARCERMLLAGLVEGLMPDSCTPARAIGYRQMLWYLYDCTQDSSFICREQLVECLKDIQVVTRQFCHRQFTWFRGDSMFTWVDASPSPAQVAATILERCAEPFHAGGDPDQPGMRLTREQQKEMKGYTATWTLMHQPDAVDRVLDLLRAHLPTNVSPMEEGAALQAQRRKDKAGNGKAAPVSNAAAV